MKWATLSEGDVGDAFRGLSCSICGGALNSNLAWFPRDIYEKEAQQLTIAVIQFNPTISTNAYESLVFCFECKCKVEEFICPNQN